MTRRRLEVSTWQWVLLVATATCYLAGYLIALVADSAVGWVLVTLGGPLLIALVIITIRRVHLTIDQD